MFELFLELINRLVQLLELKEQQKRELFQDIVEPLFKELQPVVDNYLGLFRRARAMAAEKPNIMDAATELRGRREEHLRLRVQVRNLAGVVRDQVKDEQVASFTSSVADFFYETELTLDGGSFGAYLVDLADYASGSLSEEAVVLGKIGYTFRQYVDDVLRKLEQRWEAISKEYAALRLHCLA